MTFNGENYLKSSAINAKRFNLKKSILINCCELDSNSTGGRQALHPNSENSPRPPHCFLYRTAGLF